MHERIDSVTSEILRKITPTIADRDKMMRIAQELELKVSAACEEQGLDAVIRVEGSLAKDTWIKGDPDIDVFMQLPPSIPRSSLGELALKIARKATEGSRQIERFAEHPYLEAFLDDVRVNIVPCYMTKPGEWLSATDRTPYHTDYINSHLDRTLRGDVRLLKRFMKGIGVYGAEIKVGGFSGYLCELLVLHYGSFPKVLEVFSQHKPRRVIDIEDFYVSRSRDLELLFSEPLVIIDPVDKARNVAAAVQSQKLHVFAAASQVFLKEPSEDFFFPLKTQSLSVEELEETLNIRGPSLVFVTFGEVKAIPDVLWGQLHHTRKALRKQLELAGFKVLRDTAWSEDNADITILVFEIEQRFISMVKKHLGPPLEFSKECESFVAKYSSNNDVVAGPFIDDGRWVVEVRRKFTDSAEFLRAKVGSGGRDVGVADLIAKEMPKSLQVLIGDEILMHYTYNEGFAGFLTDFLSGKPFWLETKCGR